MKNLIYTFAVALTMVIAVGCGKKSSNNTACGYGGVWNGYTCSNAYGYGYDQYGNGYGGYGSYSMEIVGTVSVTNSSVYSQLLRANGMCSRYDWNFGSEKCSRYNNGGSIVLRTSGVNGPAMVELGSTTNSLYSNPIYAGWIPQPYGNQYSAPASYSPLYSSGQIVANGANLVYTSYNGLQIYIEGTSLTGTIRMQLNYGNQPFGTVYGRRRL